MAVYYVRNLTCIFCNEIRRARCPEVDGVMTQPPCWECGNELFSVGTLEDFTASGGAVWRVEVYTPDCGPECHCDDWDDEES